MTNREKLRQMTDEELGEFLCNLVPESDGFEDCIICPAQDMCRWGNTGLIDWLKAEAEEDND